MRPLWRVSVALFLLWRVSVAAGAVALRKLRPTLWRQRTTRQACDQTHCTVLGDRVEKPHEQRSAASNRCNGLASSRCLHQEDGPRCRRHGLDVRPSGPNRRVAATLRRGLCGRRECLDLGMCRCYRRLRFRPRSRGITRNSCSHLGSAWSASHARGDIFDERATRSTTRHSPVKRSRAARHS
jgi:hypothetical protein